MWLLSEDVARTLQQTERSELAPTAQQRAEFQARADASAVGGMPRNMSIAGDTAEIRVEGVLTPRPDFILWLLGLGNTTYRSIQDALAVARSDPAIKSAVMYVDSPGGNVAGLFDALAAIQGFSKPMRVRAANAQSAAYAIASVAGKIEATNAAATFGSVGVAVDFSFAKDEELISLTNSSSPDKRPDPHTAEGQAVITRHLNALHELFVDSIARGRGMSADLVSKNFGRGATLLAGEALKRGMIDSIAGSKPTMRTARAQSATGAMSATKESSTMDANEIRVAYPAAAAELITQGVAQERDRVMAHITMGRQAGDLQIALKAVEDGSPMTQTLQAQYMSVALNRRDRRLRQDECDAAGLALDGVAGAGREDAGGTGDQAAAIMAQRRGKVIANGALTAAVNAMWSERRRPADHAR